MTNKKTAKEFLALIHKLAEKDDTFWDGLEIGKLDGNTFIIFESWERSAMLNAQLNGYAGDCNIAILWGRENLNDELNKAETKLEKTILENPEHLGTISRLKTEVCQLLNLSAYRRWLLHNEISSISLDDFENVECGFSDEYQLCCEHRNGCENVVRIQADCWDWTPPLLTDEGYCCSECAPNFKDYVLEEYKNKAKSIPADFSPDELGLIKANIESFENGMHGGQNDTPDPIINALNTQNIDVWFTVEPSQFDIRFDVYVKTEDLKHAVEVLSNTNTKLDYDPAEQCKKALQSASLQSSELNGQGIVYSKIDIATGTAETRIVSPEEFIKGIK